MLLSLRGTATAAAGEWIRAAARPPAHVFPNRSDAGRPGAGPAPLFVYPMHPDSEAASPTVELPPAGSKAVSIVTQPAISLTDQDGNVYSSVGVTAPTDDLAYFGPYPEAPTNFGPYPGEPIDFGPYPGEPIDFGTIGGAPIDDELAWELTPEGMAALPTVPWAHVASITGTLTAERSWMTFAIPVGPRTDLLRMAVRDGGAAMPKIDQLYLIGANGKLVACVSGVASFSPGEPQSLTISLHAPPPRGYLVVRMAPPSFGFAESSLSTPEILAGSSAGAGASPAIDSPINFTVDVQRDDSADPSSSPSLPVTVVSSTPVWYAPPPASQGGSQVGLPSASVSTSSAGRISSNYTVNTAARTEKPSVSAVSADDDEGAASTSISLGPLVSRGSSPMGPALATRIDDPAPTINRNGQYNLDRLVGADPATPLSLQQNARPDGTVVVRLNALAGLGEATEDDADPLTALKGLGGLPLMVASVRNRRMREQADELAATLRESAEQAAALVAAPEDARLSPTERTNENEGLARAGLATRAVGFVIALGLASGPLYPDLVAFARRKLSRKRRGGPSPFRRFFNRRTTLPLA